MTPPRLAVQNAKKTRLISLACALVFSSFSFPLSITGLLFGVNVPHDVIGKTIDTVAGALGHFGETLCFGLVFEGVAGEIDAFLMLVSREVVKMEVEGMIVEMCWEGGGKGKGIPDLCTSALTMMFTPPIPSSSISSSLF